MRGREAGMVTWTRRTSRPRRTVRESALVPALWNHRYEMAEAALRHGAQPDMAVDGGKPLLNQFVRWGQVEPALWLLERGANPNLPDERGWTAVDQAASRGNKRLWRAVLDAGGDAARPDARGQTPLDLAGQKRAGK